MTVNSRGSFMSVNSKRNTTPKILASSQISANKK